MYTLLQ